MTTFRNAEQLRIFVGEQVRLGHRPLYEEIVRESRLHGLAGATVLKGILSFGHDMEIHTAKVMEFATNLPVFIDIVDEEEKITTFIPVLETLVRDAGARVRVTRSPLQTAIIG